MNLVDVIIEPENVEINVADTLTWVGLGIDTANVVESYSGEFKSPFLGEPPDTFSYTFDRPGIYAHQVYWYSGRSTNGLIGSPPFFGSVTVVPWSNSPPAVTINTPVDGIHFGWLAVRSEWISILATVTNEISQIARVEFYTGFELLGSATNAPYQLTWTNAPVGTHVLTARSIDKGAAIAVSRPVTIVVEEAPAPRLHAVRTLRGGLFAFDYVRPPIAGSYYVHSSRDLIELKQVKLIEGSGTFIGEMSTNQKQFFWIRERF